MRNLIFTMLTIFLMLACNNIHERNRKKLDLEDTTIVKYLLNRIIKVEQFLNEDSMKKQVAKIEYYLDNILLKEYYHNYMTSEYDGFGDGEYQYFYNKEHKKLLEYYIESPSGDTVKRCYKYNVDNKNCTVSQYDYRKRLRSDMPHGDIIMPEDLTEKRIWLYDRTWTNTYDENNKLVRHYEPIKDYSITNQNLYTYIFKEAKLIEEKSFLNDSIPYYSEEYEYKKDTIIMTHLNYDNWPIPSYKEISILDKNGNVILIDKYDNNDLLMRRYIKRYDIKNRLITEKCFDEKNKLKLSHKLIYEAIE